MAEKLPTPEHRNSLGYVISDRLDVRGLAQAQIVFGRREDGTRVSIDEAKRGGSEHLKCECGADLVARKGDIYIHHFAHVAGGGRDCRQAQMSALNGFASAVVLSAANLLLPVLRGKQRTIEIADVRALAYGDCAGLIVATTKNGERREMAVLLIMKRDQFLPLVSEFAEKSLSAISIDLTPYRNTADTVIARAIVKSAKRRWIYNDRYPAAVAEQDRTESAARLPRLSTGLSASSRQSGPLISEAEWKTLSPVELRRRLFGNKYDP
jgi:hypothetical protein